MNSQQIEERIRAKVKQINFKLSELQIKLSVGQKRLAASDSNQIKLQVASLKGRRRGLLEAIQLLNETWTTDANRESLLNACQHLGETPEEQLQKNQAAMDWCKKQLNALNDKWKIK